MYTMYSWRCIKIDDGIHCTEISDNVSPPQDRTVSRAVSN